jgi:hypothetical protein
MCSSIGKDQSNADAVSQRLRTWRAATSWDFGCELSCFTRGQSLDSTTRNRSDTRVGFTWHWRLFWLLVVSTVATSHISNATACPRIRLLPLLNFRCGCHFHLPTEVDAQLHKLRSDSRPPRYDGRTPRRAKTPRRYSQQS